MMINRLVPHLSHFRKPPSVAHHVLFWAIQHQSINTLARKGWFTHSAPTGQPKPTSTSVGVLDIELLKKVPTLRFLAATNHGSDSSLIKLSIMR